MDLKPENTACSAGVEILPDEGAPIAVPDSVNAIRADRAVILQIVFPILLNNWL